LFSISEAKILLAIDPHQLLACLYGLVLAQNTPTVSVQFSDITSKAGIESRHFKGKKDISTILEEAGPGRLRFRFRR
jgi:hypothetical protein